MLKPFMVKALTSYADSIEVENKEARALIVQLQQALDHSVSPHGHIDERNSVMKASIAWLKANP